MERIGQLNAVSVVIASNRMDAYLDEAIASVLASTGVEVEIVLVLDGIELAKPKPSWAADNRIRVVSRAVSGGPAAAANDGISVARHEIIARLDSDDLMSPTRFQKQLQALQSAPESVLVGSKTILIDDSGEPIGTPQQPCGTDIRRDLLLQNVVPHSTFMFRKADALAAGMYDAQLRQMEDYDFLLRMARRGPVSMICEPLVHYRVHPHQTSKKAKWRADYISAVITGRIELGKFLGVSSLEVHTKNLIWRLVQIVRSAGILKPRYLIGVKKNELQT